MKYNRSTKYLANSFFWRTHDRKEIDYIEEKDGMLNTFEIKWNSKKQAKLPQVFRENYPNNTFTLIDGDNWIDLSAKRSNIQ